MDPAARAAGGVPLGADELRRMDAYWRAANYLSVGQIYLLDNPLLSEPLTLSHIKPRLLGHWGTTPGLNFIYVHLNRLIRSRDLDAIYVCGPGHGGPGMVANAYLEGTYSEVYPHIGRDREGLRRLFRQFSFPGGIPSHVAPETPGSIHEGGELGYALAHAYGAAFDNPGLWVFCIVGDGEAETGALAASWHSNKFLHPQRDGVVVPILHLNGYKIANPTVLARIPEADLSRLLEGYGYRPHFVSGDQPEAMHQLMAATLDQVAGEVASLRQQGDGWQRWPMIVLRTPKGWTGPKQVDGVQVEGTFRSHQVPVADLAERPDHLTLLEGWLRSYRPQELFDADGRLVPELASLPPVGARRMSANPHANGGLLLKELELPDFRRYAVPVPKPGTTFSEATRVLGQFLRDVMKANGDRFRVLGPDETASNRLQAIFEATDRTWLEPLLSADDHLAPDGRVMEVLSEHLCQGWLEGYLLTGRHGLFNCYEVFNHGEKESCARAVELFLYFQNRLSGQDRTAFEEHLPMCSACTQQLLDLRETERMADATELEPSQAERIFERSRARLQNYLDVKYGKTEPARTGFASWLAKFFRLFPLPAYANAALIALLLILLYPAYKSFVLEDRLTQVEKELAAEQSTGHARIAALEAERKDYQQQAHRLNEERRALLAPNLSSSAIQTVRSERGGRVQTIDVKFSPQEKSFNLLLSVEGLDFDTYVVEILQDKTVLWREEIRPARAGASPFALLSVTLHRDYFQAGTYRLAVYGKAAERTVRLEEYHVRIST